MNESWLFFVRFVLIIIIYQFQVYKVSLIISTLIYTAAAVFIYYVITRNPEIAKLLKYSENVEICKLRKEKDDFETLNKEKLFKKFHLI